jgi:hypothetical protein
MKKYILVMFCLLFSVFSINAFAEGGCPNGEYPQEGPGWRTCIPFPPGKATANQPAGPAYQNQWGALAVDANTGSLGTELNGTSKSDAATKAIADCKSKGGESCTVMIQVRNACMAMVVAPDDLFTEGGSTKTEAEDKVMKHCNGQTGKCGIYFSGCSVPVVSEP